MAGTMAARSSLSQDASSSNAGDLVVSAGEHNSPRFRSVVPLYFQLLVSTPDLSVQQLTNWSARSRGDKMLRPAALKTVLFVSAICRSAAIKHCASATLPALEYSPRAPLLTRSKCDVRQNRDVHHVAIAMRLSTTAPLTEYASNRCWFSGSMNAFHCCGEICRQL